MPALIDTSLWIDFTRSRSPQSLKRFIAPYILSPDAALAEWLVGQEGDVHEALAPPLRCIAEARRQRVHGGGEAAPFGDQHETAQQVGIEALGRDHGHQYR